MHTLRAFDKLFSMILYVLCFPEEFIYIGFTFEYNQYYNTGYTILGWFGLLQQKIEKTEFLNIINIGSGWFELLTALGKYSKEFYADFVNKVSPKCLMAFDCK